MVNENLIEAIDSGSEQKCGLAVYWTFIHRMDRCFGALCECAEGCGKDNAIEVIKESFSSAKSEAELGLRETLLFLANRGRVSDR